MKLFVLFSVVIISSILASSTDAGICSRVGSRRESRVERRANRYELQLGDRMFLSPLRIFRIFGASGGLFGC